MLEPSITTVRLFLHVLAATVWVGGQLTLAGLVPGLRALGDDLPKALARRFARIAWPAYGVLWFTGLWNLLEVEPTWGTDYGATLMLKILVAVVSGMSAFLHAVARGRAALAVWGALTGLSAIAALFLGVLLHG